MDLRDLIKLAGIVNPELLNRIEPTAQATDCGCGVEEDAEGAGFDRATTKPEEEIFDDPMASAGSTVDLSLRRYLKAKGDHVTVDEAVYPDFTVEDVNEAYAAFKERAPHDRRGNIYGGNATQAAQDSKAAGTLDPEQNMFLDPTLLPRMPSKMSSPKPPKKTNEAEADLPIEEGTYMKQWYNYSEDYAMLELYVDGKLVDKWDGYFGANETGNPLQAKFIEIAKENGVDPVGLKVIDGDDGDEGVFTSSGLKWNSNEAEVEENAFNQAAAAAARANKDSFEFNGKTYKTKMDKSTAHKLDDDVDMLRKLAGLV